MSGSIGAFYFGDIPVTISATPIDLTIEVITPTVYAGEPTNVITSPVYLSLQIPTPTVYAFEDYIVDFVGIPRSGSSPLIVDFYADIKFLSDTPYTIDSYNWYFNYNEAPTTYVTCAGTSATNEYTGYAGKKYSVKLIVKLLS